MIREDYRRLGQGWETGSRVAKTTYCLSVGETVTVSSSGAGFCIWKGWAELWASSRS